MQDHQVGWEAMSISYYMDPVLGVRATVSQLGIVQMIVFSLHGLWFWLPISTPVRIPIIT